MLFPKEVWNGLSDISWKGQSQNAHLKNLGYFGGLGSNGRVYFGCVGGISPTITSVATMLTFRPLDGQTYTDFLCRVQLPDSYDKTFKLPHVEHKAGSPIYVPSREVGVFNLHAGTESIFEGDKCLILNQGHFMYQDQPLDLEESLQESPFTLNDLKSAIQKLDPKLLKTTSKNCDLNIKFGATKIGVYKYDRLVTEEEITWESPDIINFLQAHSLIIKTHLFNVFCEISPHDVRVLMELKVLTANNISMVTKIAYHKNLGDYQLYNIIMGTSL